MRGLFIVVLFFLAPIAAYADDYTSQSPLEDSTWRACGQVILGRIAFENQPSQNCGEGFCMQVPGAGIDPNTCRVRSNNLTTWARGACDGNECEFMSSDRAFEDGAYRTRTITMGAGVVYSTETGLPTEGVTEIPYEDWNCTNKRDTGQEGGYFLTMENCSAEGTDLTWRRECRNNADGDAVQCRALYGGIGGEKETDWFAVDGSSEVVLQVTEDGQNTFREDGEDTGTQSRGIVEDVLSNVGDWTIEIVAAIIFYVTEFIIWILLILLALIAWLMDSIVVEFVIQMGKYTTSEDATAIRAAWVMIRDLANIGIIAGLVATAVGTIVGAGNYSISKTLARLILAALLVNFSYFFAGAIIDFSNFTARAAYYSLVTEKNCTGECGPAGRLIKVIELQKFRDRAGNDAAQAQTGGNAAVAESQQDFQGESGTGESISISRYAAFNVMEIIFIIILSFVLLSAISLLVARFVALIFLLVTSPIGIAGGSVPMLKSYADEWWKAMWSQAMFAPVYFVLLGISLNIIGQFADAFKGGTFAVAEAGGMLQSTIGIMTMFILAIGFTWTALSTAKKMSEEGGRFKELYGAANKAIGWLPGAYKTVGGIVLRDTAGQALYHMNEGYRKFAAKNNLATFDKAKKIPLVGGLINAAVRGSDNTIQNLLHKGANQEFVKGVKGYEKTRQEKQARQALLGEVKREEEQLASYGKKSQLAEDKEKAALEQQKQKEVDRAAGETGEDNDDKYWGRQALRDLKIRKKDGTWETDQETRDRLGIKNNEELLKDHLDKKGKSTGKKVAKTIEDLVRERGDKMRQKKADGSMETDAEITARLKAEQNEGLGRKRRVSNKGKYVNEDVYDYDERIDKMKKLGAVENDNISYREARSDAEAIFATFTNDFIKRKYEEDPEGIVALAKWAPYDKFKQINEDKSIRRDLRDKMASNRWGKYAKEVAEIQAAVDSGEIVEFGEEYQRRMLGPYQYMQNNMKTGAEYEDFMRSTGAVEITDANGQKKTVKFEELRNSRAMQHAFSSSKFVDMKDAKIFGTTEQRNMNTNKRKNITNDRDEWAAIEMALGHRDNEWAVVNAGGTTNYNAAQRGENTIKEQLDAMDKVLGVGKYAGRGSKIQSEIDTARKRKAELELIQKGEAAAGISRFATPKERDDYIRETKKKFRAEYTVSSSTPPEERAQKEAAVRALKESGDPLDKLLVRQIELEGGFDAEDPSGIAGWQKGKNEKEAAGILGKREVVSPPIVASLDVDRFQSIYMAGHDKVEKDLMWNMMLIYGKKEVVQQILSNEHLRQMVSLPDGELRKTISEERERVHGETIDDLLPESEK